MNYGVASGYADYSGELYIIRFLKKNIRQNGVIFDVGANLGDWSQYIINEYKEIPYKLYLFEPSLKTFEKLIQNITVSENKFLYPLGLGDKEEKLNIYYNFAGEGSASILKKEGHYNEEIEITTLDIFCQRHGIQTIDFLKMDVQGYEYNILLGAKEMLERQKIKVIQFEFDEPNIANRIFFKDFWDLLHEKYTIYHSLYNGLIKIEKYHYSLENFNCMNYLAVLKD